MARQDTAHQPYKRDAHERDYRQREPWAETQLAFEQRETEEDGERCEENTEKSSKSNFVCAVRDAVAFPTDEMSVPKRSNMSSAHHLEGVLRAMSADGTLERQPANALRLHIAHPA